MGSERPARPRDGALGAVFALLTLIWGSTWLAIKIGLEHYPPFFSLAVRFGIAGPLFLALMKLRREPIPWQPRHQPFFLAVALLTFTASFGVTYWSEQYVTSGLAAVLFALMPILTSVLAHFLLHHERLRAATLGGLALSLMGIVVIYSSDLSQIHPRAPLAAAVFLLSPVVISLSNVITKRRSRDFSPLAVAGIPMTYGAVAHTVLWRAFERGYPLRWSWPGAASIAFLTLFGSMVAFGGYYWLLRHLAVGRLSLMAYLTPLVALALGIVAGGETFTPGMGIGTALVLSGTALAGLRLPFRRAPAEAPE